jgi:hypothetical protein
MRPLIFAAVATAMLFASSPSFAAPTCQDKLGGTIRCGTPGAMPVGWTLPADQRLSQAAEPNIEQLLKLACVLGVFFALMALLPDFEGWREEEEPVPIRDDAKRAGADRKPPRRL